MTPSEPAARTASGHSDATQDRLRRLNLIMLIPGLAAVGGLLVVVSAENWWHAVVLGLGVVAALVAVERWIADRLFRVAVPCLVVTGAVWIFEVLVPDGETVTAFYGLTIVGPILIPQLPRRRGAAALGLSAFVAVVGAARLLVAPGDVHGVLMQYVLIPTGVTVTAIGLMFVNRSFYRLLAELEESREREAELAVIRERVRFAGDLHDIQGHTLHVVKLKVTLAQRLVHSDIERVEQELGEVRALVSDTIAQTKELAYAQRRLNLSAELENAKNLFEAADIRVRVDREAEVDTRAGELLGQVLRETTTNILRHAQAEQVQITLARSGITIRNDGVRDEAPPTLRGLSALRERVAGAGGELTVEQRDGRFLTSAEFPHLRTDAAPVPTRKDKDTR